MGYIYIIQDHAFAVANTPIYKIGYFNNIASIDDIKSKVIHILIKTDSNALVTFRSFRQRMKSHFYGKDHGLEFDEFEGDITNMKLLLMSL